MSRVHDALRKAEQLNAPTDASNHTADEQHDAGSIPNEPHAAAVLLDEPVIASPKPATHTPSTPEPEEARPVSPRAGAIVMPTAPAVRNGNMQEWYGPASLTVADMLDLHDLLDKIEEVPFTPAPDTHMIDVQRPHEAPTEEFRTLRTRLNHLQSVQPIHSVVVTSPSPAEGKSLAAVNLAIAESQLAGSMTLLADFDFRRPVVHQLFQVDRSPGLTDYLLGKVKLEDAVKRIAGTNLCIIPAGEAVINPLELMNLPAVKSLLKSLPSVFNWVILDSPPLLFAADGALLGTMCDGTILVVRIGRTTVDSVTRAIHSLCENNILGTVVNGARRGELYSKYTYYHSYYSSNNA